MRPFRPDRMGHICKPYVYVYTIFADSMSRQSRSGKQQAYGFMRAQFLFTSWFMVLAVSLGSTGGMAAPSLPQQSGLKIADCVIGTEKYSARCGTFSVYEDRAASSGRTIALPIVVLPAKHPAHKAIFWNPGGPGAGATPLAPFIAAGLFAKELTQLRERYDIVLVDNRGIGGARPQQCATAPPEHPEYYFLQIWPDALLKACRDRLAADADLSLYTSTLAADDLDDIRAALGYPKIVLDGASYGTLFYLAYMRQHPNHVESAILDGVAPPGLLIVPLQDAAGAQLAMDQLFAACAQDADCAVHFPHFAAHFAELLHRFDGGPIAFSMPNPATHEPQTVLLSKEVFADRLRQTMYVSAAAAYVPYILERAYLQDYGPLGRMIDATTRGLAGLVEVGANLSVTCAEDIPFITEEETKRSSAGSFEGNLRVRAQQRACGIWNVKPVAANFNEPVRSQLPVLMVSGSDDPTTPPKYAELALPYLPNARRVIVQGAAHVTETPCTDRLKVEFVLSRSARGLDVSSCSNAFHRPPFTTSMDGFEAADPIG
jgi:pimeloyl-ACP methyl ester carboxylesterase